MYFFCAWTKAVVATPQVKYPCFCLTLCLRHTQAIPRLFFPWLCSSDPQYVSLSFIHTFAIMRKRWIKVFFRLWHDSPCNWLTTMATQLGLSVVIGFASYFFIFMWTHFPNMCVWIEKYLFVWLYVFLSVHLLPINCTFWKLYHIPDWHFWHFFSDFSHLHLCMYLFVLFHTDCIIALSAVECLLLIVTQGQ